MGGRSDRNVHTTLTWRSRRSKTKGGSPSSNIRWCQGMGNGSLGISWEMVELMCQCNGTSLHHRKRQIEAFRETGKGFYELRKKKSIPMTIWMGRTLKLNEHCVNVMIKVDYRNENPPKKWGAYGCGMEHTLPAINPLLQRRPGACV